MFYLLNMNYVNTFFFCHYRDIHLMFCLNDRFTLKPPAKSIKFLFDPIRYPVSKIVARQIDSLSRVDDKIGNSSTICDSLFQRISEMKNDRS